MLRWWYFRQRFESSRSWYKMWKYSLDVSSMLSISMWNFWWRIHEDHFIFPFQHRIQWNNCDHGTQNIAIRSVNSTHNSHKCTHSSYFYNILHWSFLFGLLVLKIHFIFIFVDFYSLDDTLIVQNDAVPMCRTFTLKIFLLLSVLLLLVAFINILSCLSCL